MSMLRMAIKARLPIVAVRTKDPLNVGTILAHYAGTEVARVTKALSLRMDTNAHAVTFHPNRVSYVFPDDIHLDYYKTYVDASKAGATLLVINPDDLHPTMFDAGEAQLPDSMISEFVAEYADDETEHYALEAALRGLTFKEMVETSKLAMTASGEFTADSVLTVRRQRTVLSSGLQLVNTKQVFYSPSNDLKDWLGVDGKLFRSEVPDLVRPRGLLFTGEPGTGKTSGAKFLAHTLGVPLYLLDVGSTMQKYVGESERTFSNALAQVEALAPCVLLLDEVEKAFSHEDDSGVSRRVLGMLLWWLQEHTSKVFTIMTTNAHRELPQELTRPGRLDNSIYFARLTEPAAVEFALGLMRGLVEVYALSASDVRPAVMSLYGGDNVLHSQADITKAVVDLIKVRMAAAIKD